ncbi:MAG: TonB-dependent receptor domain-containing protein [Pseudorhodobacter sp.]
MKTRTTLGASAAMMLAVQALATSTAAQDGLLGTITLEESLRKVATETATPKTVVEQEELDARQASTLAELIGTVPGVTLSNAATPQGSAVNIRGLGADAGTYGSNSKVNLVIDGVPKGQEEIYRQGSLLTMEPELFKEITVIRGPTESFRFSAGAIGGTIEAVTKDAADFLNDGDSFAFRLKTGYETNGNGRLATGILAFAPDDRLDVIGFAGYRDSENYEDGDGTEEADTLFRLPSGLIKVKYRLSEDLSLTGSVSRSKNRLRDVNYDYIGSLFPARVNADITDTTAYLALNYDPLGNDFINLTAKLSFSDEEIANISDTVSSDIYNADNRTKTLNFRLENEAVFATGSVDHNLLGGLEIGRRKRSSLTDTGTNSGSAPGGTDEYVALYLTDRMEIGNFTVTPQLRYESQTLTSRGNEAPYRGVPGPLDGTEFKKDAWAGAVSARYAFDNGLALFGTVAYNENLPIIDDLRDPTRRDLPEQATTYEAGFSYAATSLWTAEDNFNAKLTGFDTRIWNNTTYTNPTSDKIKLHGIEIELSYAHPQFYVDFNASRVRGKWGDGQFFNNAPADTALLRLGKRFMDDQLDLSVEAIHAWSNDRSSDTSGPTAPSASHTVYGLSAAYRPISGPMAGVEFRASVDNLFDESYQPYLSSRPAPGRSLNLSLAKLF